MSDGDPIVAARTVAEFMARLAVEYGLDLPVDEPPAGTALGQVWRQAVTVVHAPGPGVRYRATTPLHLAEGWAGTLWIEVR